MRPQERYAALQVGIAVASLCVLVQALPLRAAAAPRFLRYFAFAPLPHSSTACAAPQWLALAGSMCPAVATLSVLQAQDGAPSALRARLHTSLVLAALLGAAVFLGLAGSLSAAGAGKSLADSLAVAAGLLCAALAGLGAKMYLPFDLPTALGIWLLPRGGNGRWRSWTPAEGVLTVAVVAGLAEVLILMPFNTHGLHPSSVLAVNGLRAAMSLVAVVCLTLFRDLPRKQGRAISPARARSMASLLAGLVAYASALALGVGLGWATEGLAGVCMAGESSLGPSAAIWLSSALAALFASAPRAIPHLTHGEENS